MVDAQEAAYQQMLTEWSELVSPASAEERQPPDFHAWETDIARIAAEHDTLVTSGRWVVGVDDILTIVRRAHLEAHHSAMIAWLLNPLGKHGLGTALLDRLLQYCGVYNSPALRRANVVLEVQRSGTRADIVVFAPGTTLVIENKVYAGEQERQCDRLHEHFGEDPGAVFLFLTPTGRTPSTATGLVRATWTSLSYPHLADMIEAVRSESSTNPSASGVSAVTNYLKTLRREFV